MSLVSAEDEILAALSDGSSPPPAHHGTMELFIEDLERLPHRAVFAKVELMLSFKPGHSHRGAIIQNFLNAIHTHDQIVHQVEEAWQKVDYYQKLVNKSNKLYRNMDSFFYVCNANPLELLAFEEMIPRMKNIHERLKQITDKKVRQDVIDEYKAFKRKQKKFDRILALRDRLSEAKTVRDKHQEELVSFQQQLNDWRVHEESAANKISQDHMAANEKRITLHELYPNIKVGHILIQINNNYVEFEKFDEILNIIKYTPAPHTCVFKRYNYSFDMITGKWVPLKQKRIMNMYIEDPLLRCRDFFAFIKAGNGEEVMKELIAGTDPNTYDHTLTSAVHVAAVNNHAEIVRVLCEYGANIHLRDKNMYTPLLSCVKKGLVDMVKLLLELGAEKYVSDRMSRSTIYFTAMSGRLELARLFITRDNSDTADNIWGLTPLHVAARRGDLAFVQYLLDIDANIYVVDKTGKTAEDLAAEAKAKDVFQLLKDTREDSSPAQLAYRVHRQSKECSIWIGEHSALESSAWLGHVPLAAVFCILSAASGEDDDEDGDAGDAPMVDRKKISPDDIQYIPLKTDDDDETPASWDAVCKILGDFASALSAAVERGGNILICDPTGFSTSAAVLCAYLLLKYQLRVEQTEALCVTARPSVYISLSLKKGLMAMQDRLDKMRMKRLDDRLRTSPVVSLAF